MSTVPGPPRGTRAAGRRLWASILTGYELEEHETVLLRQAVRIVDDIAELDAVVRRDGVIVSSAQGDRAHPALVEARQQRMVLAKLLAAMRLPVGTEGEQPVGGTRPQRRVGVRGPYGLTVAG